MKIKHEWKAKNHLNTSFELRVWVRRYYLHLTPMPTQPTIDGEDYSISVDIEIFFD
jgi:hypothetical protein